jgi:Ni,Fe-hydrogenase I small subunit
MIDNDSNITRKSLLKTATAAAAAVTLGTVFKPTLRAFAQTSQSQPVEPGHWKSTTGQGCTSGCSVQLLRSLPYEFAASL